MVNPLFLEFADETQPGARMKVVGVGGGGSNSVDRMIALGLRGVEYIAINTDQQALDRSLANRKIQIGRQLTRGLGAGADPNKGREAAEQDSELLIEALQGADLVFVTAGMGGGTGTGAAPKVAEIARGLGALTIAVVSKPFLFEGTRRMAVAEAGIKELRANVDAMVIVPNQRLLNVIDQSVTMLEAFKRADSVLTDATRGITDLISFPGIVNLDFADVKAIMSGSGDALMGIGSAFGEDRGKRAAIMALHAPLLEDMAINGAQGVIVNITGSSALTLYEVNEAAVEVTAAVGENANFIFGTAVDETLGEEIRVTVIATGFNRQPSLGMFKPEVKVEAKPKLYSEAGVTGAVQPRPAVVPPITPSTDTSLPPFLAKEPPAAPPLRKSIQAPMSFDSPEAEDFGFRTPKSNGNRIRLEVDLDGAPPTDFDLPPFLSRNGRNGH